MKIIGKKITNVISDIVVYKLTLERIAVMNEITILNLSANTAKLVVLHYFHRIFGSSSSGSNR